MTEKNEGVSKMCYGYLAKAEHRLGNGEQAWSWFELAEKTGKQIPELSEMLARVKQELRESLN
jgi:hypothetical protein